ncbi:hypothetical protein DY000_02012138 [Brassica cretica]|uniref:SCP domain-containing protein n=1 Tax=Brassica cretica TaxID=69181 RepID=A0ABQ7CV55_BRACR|nr:hypothetical protein DY000_02012138 [Brassica cretica]
MSFSGYSFVVLTLFSIVLTQIYGLGKVDPMYDLKPEETLAIHNQIRADVGVAPLVWDDKLAAYAQNYANVRSKDCAMKHSTDGMYGENLAAGWVQPLDTMSGPIATKFWLTEKPNYNYDTNRCSGTCVGITPRLWPINRKDLVVVRSGVITMSMFGSYVTMLLGQWVMRTHVRIN